MQLCERRLTKGTFKVPVIAVFTKFDQFKRDVRMKLEDAGPDSGTNLDEEAERLFRELYQSRLGESPRFVRLESKNFSL